MTVAYTVSPSGDDYACLECVALKYIVSRDDTQLQAVDSSAFDIFRPMEYCIHCKNIICMQCGSVTMRGDMLPAYRKTSCWKCGTRLQDAYHSVEFVDDGE